MASITHLQSNVIPAPPADMDALRRAAWPPFARAVVDYSKVPGPRTGCFYWNIVLDCGHTLLRPSSYGLPAEPYVCSECQHLAASPAPPSPADLCTNAARELLDLIFATPDADEIETRCLIVFEALDAESA